VRFEGATNPSEGDGSGTPAKLICCHIMPTANLPASSAAVYSADVATDSTPVVFEIGAARAVVASTLLHPARGPSTSQSHPFDLIAPSHFLLFF
jgi:hypothetical protein